MRCEYFTFLGKRISFVLLGSTLSAYCTKYCTVFSSLVTTNQRCTGIGHLGIQSSLISVSVGFGSLQLKRLLPRIHNSHIAWNTIKQCLDVRSRNEMKLRSPESTPPDKFFYDYLKSKIYAKNARTFHELKANTCAEIIARPILENVMENVA